MFVCRKWAFDVMIRYFMQYMSIETKERQIEHYEMCEYKHVADVWIWYCYMWVFEVYWENSQYKIKCGIKVVRIDVYISEMCKQWSLISHVSAYKTCKCNINPAFDNDYIWRRLSCRRCHLVCKCLSVLL